jgi:hypothetical protein
MTKALGIALALLALAATVPSVERGRALFLDSALGTNGRSCATCHEGGKRLEDLGEYDDARLGAYVDTCIEGMLKGKPLPRDSADLRSLVLYLRTFQHEKR